MDELQDALRAIMAAQRGRHLTAEEQSDYHDDKLSEDEAERVVEHLAACPECASTALDLAQFPDIEAPTAHPVDAQHVADGLERLRDRLDHDRLDPPTPSPPAQHERDAAPRGVSADAQVWLRRAAAVVLLLASGGLGAFLARQPASTSDAVRVNAVLVELEPLGSAQTRSDSAVAVTVPESAGGLVIVLTLADETNATAYTASVRADDDAGSLIWSSDGLRRLPEGHFMIELPRSLLGSGGYAIELEAIDGGQRTRLATYAIRLAYD